MNAFLKFRYVVLLIALGISPFLTLAETNPSVTDSTVINASGDNIKQNQKPDSDIFLNTNNEILAMNVDCIRSCNMRYTGLECSAFTNDPVVIKKCEEENERKKRECLLACPVD